MFLFILLVFLILSFLLVKWSRAENVVDWGSPWVNTVDGLIRIFCRLYHRQEKAFLSLPETGSAIVVANHISGLDPFLLIAASKRPLRFLIAREEYERFGLTWLFKAAGCIPVDRKKNPADAMREALSVLDRGEVVALFPHGGIQWPTHEENTIKGGAVRLSQLKHCDLYPVFIHGVRISGTTFFALFGRSRIELDFYEPISCANKEHDVCMAQLSNILNVRRDIDSV